MSELYSGADDGNSHSGAYTHAGTPRVQIGHVGRVQHPGTDVRRRRRSQVDVHPQERLHQLRAAILPQRQRLHERRGTARHRDRGQGHRIRRVRRRQGGDRPRQEALPLGDAPIVEQVLLHRRRRRGRGRPSGTGGGRGTVAGLLALGQPRQAHLRRVGRADLALERHRVHPKIARLAGHLGVRQGGSLGPPTRHREGVARDRHLRGPVGEHQGPRGSLQVHLRRTAVHVGVVPSRSRHSLRPSREGALAGTRAVVRWTRRRQRIGPQHPLLRVLQPLRVGRRFQREGLLVRRHQLQPSTEGRALRPDA
mmetsp:Transcript_42624/g.129425  ORF Transcript_42624/g.129425 Transcript_42624/m.129425 type:complete len:309 (+) Transcript_42624:298-1224(+)